MKRWIGGTTARAFGPYVADVNIYEGRFSEVAMRLEIPVDSIPSVIQNLVTAYSQLSDRRIVDAAAGPCDRCGGTRMVRISRPGHSDETIHCPECSARGREAIERKGTPT